MSRKSNQLSLIAQYDDLIQLIEGLLSNDVLDDQVKRLLQNCEKQRLLCVLQRNELNECREAFTKTEKDKTRLQATLKHVREAFKKELKSKERLQGEFDLIHGKLKQIQGYLQDGTLGDDRSSLKETILSSLNLNKLSTVIEENDQEENSHSLSGVEFDKTDEDVIDNDHYAIVEETNAVRTHEPPIEHRQQSTPDRNGEWTGE